MSLFELHFRAKRSFAKTEMQLYFKSDDFK